MTRSEKPDRSEADRRVLIEQLSLLVDEVEALRSHIGLIPDVVISARPLDSEPSFNEIYLLLARFDEDVYVPAVEQLTQEGAVDLVLPKDDEYLSDEPAPEQDFTTTIDRVQTARRRLVALLDRIPLESWSRRVVLESQETDLFGLTYAIAQHDAALQQAAAYRLHESRLTSRDDDLPK